MKLQILGLLVLLSPVVWLLFRPRLSLLKARLARAIRIVAPIYLVILVVRLATAPHDQEQLELAGLSLAFFAGLWGLSWLITRSLAGGARKPPR